MQNKTKWTAIGAASVLGLGLIGGGAVAAAHATGVNDVSGAKVDTRPVAQTAGAAFGIPSAPTSEQTAAVTVTTDQTATPAADSSPSVATPASPISAPSAASPVSAPSAPSVASPASPASAPSPVSPVSAD